MSIQNYWRNLSWMVSSLLSRVNFRSAKARHNIMSLLQSTIDDYKHYRHIRGFQFLDHVGSFEIPAVHSGVRFGKHSVQHRTPA